MLYEIARVYEYYGTLEAALSTYSRIMNEFPNCRGYFNAMYRAALMGKTLAGEYTVYGNKDAYFPR